MNQTLQLLSENLLHMMRGALMMLFIIMCIGFYSRRRESPILGFLFWLLVIMSAMLFLSLGYMIEDLSNNMQFDILKQLIDLCLVPLFASFLLKIILPDRIHARSLLLLLSPTILLMIVYAITHNRLMLTLSFIYTTLIVTAAFIIIIYFSIHYDRYVKNNFANIDNKTVKWVRVVTYAFGVWYLFWSLIVRLDNKWLDSVYYVFMITIWIFIYKYSIKHVTAFQTEELLTSSTMENRQPLQTEISNNKFNSNLEAYMNRECPWRNPFLTLQDMAFALNTNRTYLSQYFNKTLHTTFYDYLNQFRVRYACEILISEPTLSLTLVCEKSGFNSLSTFRRAFEKHTGCTPARYRKNKLQF